MFNRNLIVLILVVTILIIGGCSQKADVYVTYNPPNYSDNSWVNGIAKTWETAFFVHYTIQAQRDLVAGKKVTFSDGTVREIVRQERSPDGGSLWVFLDGAPLDGKLVGYPNIIKVSAKSRLNRLFSGL